MPITDSGSRDSERKWSLQPLINKAERQHKRLPGIRKIPLRAIAIILFIAFINLIVWAAAAIVLVRVSAVQRLYAILT